MTEQMRECGKQNSSKAARTRCLDILRVAATLAVVLLHVLSGAVVSRGYFANDGEETIYWILMDLVSWSVPVFLMISGYLFLNPGKRITLKEMYGKYVSRIVLALLLFGVPFAGMELVLSEKCFRVNMIWRSLWMVLTGKSWAHMWYLYLILVLYLFTPLIKWVLERLPVRVIRIGMVLIFAETSLIPFVRFCMGNTDIAIFWPGGIYLFFYLEGYLLHLRKKNTSKMQVPGMLAIAVCMIGIACFSRITKIFWVNMAYNHPYTVILSMIFMRLAFACEGFLQKKNTALWEKFSGLCFGIYLTHPIFLNLFYKGFHKTIFDFRYPYLMLPLFWVGALGGAMVLSILLGRIKWLKRHVL